MLLNSTQTKQGRQRNHVEPQTRRWKGKRQHAEYEMSWSAYLQTISQQCRNSRRGCVLTKLSSGNSLNLAEWCFAKRQGLGNSWTVGCLHPKLTPLKPSSAYRAIGYKVTCCYYCDDSVHVTVSSVMSWAVIFKLVCYYCVTKPRLFASLDFNLTAMRLSAKRLLAAASPPNRPTPGQHPQWRRVISAAALLSKVSIMKRYSRYGWTYLRSVVRRNIISPNILCCKILWTLFPVEVEFRRCGNDAAAVYQSRPTQSHV